MIKILRNLILLLFLFIYSGCQPTTNGVSETETNLASDGDLQENELQIFNTATPPPNPDLRGYEYDIYFIGAVSEIFFEITTTISDGLRDGIDYLNSNGGVNGARINYHFIGVREFGDDMLGTYQDLIDDKDPFLVLLAAPINQDFYELINDSEVPVMYYGVGSSRLEKLSGGEDYLFWLTPLPDQQMAFVLEEIWANWDEIRPMGAFNEVKIGYLTWQGDQTNLSLTPQTRVFIQRNNFSLEVEQVMSVSPNTSVTNFLLDAVTDGVTVIFTDTISFGPAVLWNDLHSLGLADFFVVSGTQWMIGEDFSQYIRVSEQSDQMYIPLSTEWWTEVDNPAIVNAIEISSKYDRVEEDRTSGYLLSLGSVDIIAKILSEIVEEQGSEKIDSQIFMDYLSELKDYSVMGGLYEIDYTNGLRVVNEMRLWSYSPSEGMAPIGTQKSVPKLPLVED